MNTKDRLLVRRAYGFHSAKADLALVMLACGPMLAATLSAPWPWPLHSDERTRDHAGPPG